MELNSIVNDIVNFYSNERNNDNKTLTTTSTISSTKAKYDMIFTNEKYKHICPNCTNSIHSNFWVENERKKLVKAVNQQLGLTESKSKSKSKSKLSSIKSTTNRKKKIIENNHTGIITDINTDINMKIDWEEVAKSIGSKHSPFECMMQYQNHDRIHINKQPWTAQEESSLKEIAEMHKDCFWIDIADQLKTGRSPWDCFSHYQQVLNNKILNTSEWTEEEDRKLNNAIQEYGFKNWKNVANCIPGRSSSQCTYRWRKSIECNSTLVGGTWTDEENRRLFLAAISHKLPLAVESCKSNVDIEQLLNNQDSNLQAINNNNDNNHDDDVVNVANKKPKKSNKRKNDNEDNEKKETNWIDLAQLVGTKDASRCRERWWNHLDPTLNFDPFTPEEDAQLMKLVKILGVGNWAKIAKYMPGRTDRKLMMRWKRLEEITSVNKFEENNQKKRKKIINPKLNRYRSHADTLKDTDYVAVLKLKNSDSSLSFSKVL